MFFLPFIDLCPGIMSFIYSTLLFIGKHGKHYDIIPMITFNQLLWWKAFSTIDSEVLLVDCKISSSDQLVSTLSLVLRVHRAGSSLKLFLEQVYARNTVAHMHTGKAYGRAVHGHLLALAVLSTMLTATALNIPLRMHHKLMIEPYGQSLNEPDVDFTDVSNNYEVVESTDQQLGTTNSGNQSSFIEKVYDRMAFHLLSTSKDGNPNSLTHHQSIL